jgi:hypothetical protein
MEMSDVIVTIAICRQRLGFCTVPPHPLTDPDFHRVALQVRYARWRPSSRRARGALLACRFHFVRETEVSGAAIE